MDHILKQETLASLVFDLDTNAMLGAEVVEESVGAMVVGEQDCC